MLYLKSPLTSLSYILSWTTTKALATTFKVDENSLKGRFNDSPKNSRTFQDYAKPVIQLKAENCLKLLSTSVLCPQRAIIHQKQTFYHCVDLGVLVQKTLLRNITLMLLRQKSVKQLDLFQNYGTPYLVIYCYIFTKH